MSQASGTEPRVPDELWEAFRAGNRLACARLITRVENEPAIVPEIRDALIPLAKGAIRIGITGPPGVGKSTLTAALAQRAVQAGHTVGVIAVDPSSPFTGGAFLGDRVRMQALIGDPRVFIRSMASREGHGGLSPATPHVADVLDAFGMDRILIETVGVGQAELDVMSCTDLIVLVLQPGTGDVIQALKAGIIEAADMILVNKADLAGTDALLDSLRFLFDISARANAKPPPPVLTTSALHNQGLDELATVLESLVGEFVQSGRYVEKRRSRMEQEIKAAIQSSLWDEFAARTGTAEEIRTASARLLETGCSPYPFIREMRSRVRMEPCGKAARGDDGA